MPMIYCKRALLLVTMLLLTLHVAHAQTAPKIDWQHCYGGTWFDGGSADGSNVPKDHMLIRTRDGGYAFVAEAQSNDGDVHGNHTYGIIGTQDFWLVKTDIAGNIEWQKCFGGYWGESVKCLIQTSDDGYAMCGWTVSKDGDIADKYTDSVLVNLVTGYKWRPTVGWIVKTDSNGQKQWAHNIAPVTFYQEEYLSLIEQPDGFIIAGLSDGMDEDWHAHSNYIDSSLRQIYRPWDALILKLDKSGHHVWHRLLGGSGSEVAMSILPCASGGFIFTGQAWSRDTDVVTGQPADVRGIHAKNAYFVSSDAWVVRTDSLGRLLWQRCFGGTGMDSATCIIKTPEGYMIAASTNSNDGDVSGNHGSADGWIFTIDTNGHLLNQRCFGGSKYDVIHSIVRLSDGNYAFAGTTISNDGDVSGFHLNAADSTDGWVGEFTPDLKLLWQKCLGGTNNEYLGTVIETADGGIMVNGTAISDNGDVVDLHPGKGTTGKYVRASDVWNVKLSNPNASVEGGPVGAGFTNPYPNPSSDEVYLELFHNSQVQSMEFYNLLADQVFPDHTVQGTTAVVHVNALPPGVYLMKVNYTNGSAQIRKFVRE